MEGSGFSGWHRGQAKALGCLIGRGQMSSREAVKEAWDDLIASLRYVAFINSGCLEKIEFYPSFKGSFRKRRDVSLHSIYGNTLEASSY